ncbi:MAG: hypothetical protein WC682_04245 [Parcubacteria group bacterium]|jgi:hypothetical protein
MEKSKRNLAILFVCSLICVFLGRFILGYGSENFITYLASLGMVLYSAGIIGSFIFGLSLMIPSDIERNKGTLL